MGESEKLSPWSEGSGEAESLPPGAEQSFNHARAKNQPPQKL